MVDMRRPTSWVNGESSVSGDMAAGWRGLVLDQSAG